MKGYRFKAEYVHQGTGEVIEREVFINEEAVRHSGEEYMYAAGNAYEMRESEEILQSIEVCGMEGF